MFFVCSPDWSSFFPFVCRLLDLGATRLLSGWIGTERVFFFPFKFDFKGRVGLEGMV